MKINLEFSGDRVFIHVNIILVDGVHHEFITLWLHPSGHKWRKIQSWITIQHQLIIHNLICCFLWHRILWHLEPLSVTKIEQRMPKTIVRSDRIFTEQYLSESMMSPEKKNDVTNNREKKSAPGQGCTHISGGKSIVQLLFGVRYGCCDHHFSFSLAASDSFLFLCYISLVLLNLSATNPD